MIGKNKKDKNNKHSLTHPSLVKLTWKQTEWSKTLLYYLQNILYMFGDLQLSLPISSTTQRTGKLLLLYVPKTLHKSGQEKMKDTYGKMVHKEIMDTGFSVHLNIAVSWRLIPLNYVSVYRR